MKITKELATYLAEQGALTKFIDNHHNFFDPEYLPKDTEVIHSIDRCGFGWILTPEGGIFWLLINDDYKRIKNNENN